MAEEEAYDRDRWPNREICKHVLGRITLNSWVGAQIWRY